MAGGGGSVSETSAQKALAQHAANVMADYKARWLPAQKALIGQIEAEGGKNSALRTEARGRAANDEAIQFAGIRDKVVSAAANRGIAPGSGKFDLGVTNLASQEAKGSGLNEELSDQMVNDAYTKGLTALMQIGQGQSAEVGQSMQSQAQASGLQARADAQAALQSSEDNAQLIGTAAGFGAQRYISGIAPPVTQGSNPNGINGTMNNPSAYVATGTGP